MKRKDINIYNLDKWTKDGKISLFSESLDTTYFFKNIIFNKSLLVEALEPDIVFESCDFCHDFKVITNGNIIFTNNNYLYDQKSSFSIEGANTVVFNDERIISPSDICTPNEFDIDIKSKEITFEKSTMLGKNIHLDCNNISFHSSLIAATNIEINADAINAITSVIKASNKVLFETREMNFLGQIKSDNVIFVDKALKNNLVRKRKLLDE